jgi:hypothetical protein
MKLFIILILYIYRPYPLSLCDVTIDCLKNPWISKPGISSEGKCPGGDTQSRHPQTTETFRYTR